MMLLPSLLTVGLASLVASARTPAKRMIVHDSRSFVPSGWSPVRRAEPDVVLPLRVGLVQSNLENLEKYLLDVAHPDSPNYSKHWTPTKVATTFRPSSESVNVVRTWLVEDGWISRDRIVLSKSGSWLLVNVTVEEAEHLLGTEYHVYEHGDGRKHIGCKDGYLLPEHVSKHVDLITPTLEFVNAEAHGIVDSLSFGMNVIVDSTDLDASPKMDDTNHRISSELEHCGETITLPCLRALYDFQYEPRAPELNSIGVAEYSPQSHLPSDFDMFFGNYSKEQVGQRPTLISIDGGAQTTGGSHVESSLDLQYVMGLVGSKQEVLLYQVGDGIVQASLNDLLDALDGSYCTFEGGDDPDHDGVYPDNELGGYKGNKDCGGKRTAHVVSTSYGYTEAILPAAYMRRQCAEYGKLSLTGMTFVYSSSDWGVAGSRNLCLDENGKPASNGTHFSPSFPSTCQYVTSVGGTQIMPGNTVTDPEVALFQKVITGGGFSNVFERASFQADAVASYLVNHPPGYPSGIFNDGGRAYPDVSANALNFSVAIDGVFKVVSGTSAAAPTFASMLSAINDARLANGKTTLGWINPALYSKPFADAFNDIDSGTNPGCGTQGFAATAGWDPVTGLGTPHFPTLLSRFLALP